jgi:hypothetical protein
VTSGQDTEERRTLDRSEWSSYFDRIDKEIEQGLQLDAAIEVTSEAIDGTEADPLPLDSITYEDGDDQIAIGLGGRGRRFPTVLWHYVDHPTTVWVREDGALPAAIGIESGDDEHPYTFVRLQHAGGVAS